MTEWTEMNPEKNHKAMNNTTEWRNTIHAAVDAQIKNSWKTSFDIG